MIHQLLSSERTRPLPDAEQTRLILAYRRTRSPALERQLIEANLRFVVRIARRLDRTRGRRLDDLVQEGCLGLIQAIRRFDPAKGTRLSTYAAFWIRAFIIKDTIDNVRVVQVVRTRAQRAAFFRGALATKEVSLETASDPDATPLGDIVGDPAQAADLLLEEAELAREVQRCVATVASRVTDRDRTILHERMLAPDPVPRKVVARLVCLSEERVRQIEGTLQTAIRAVMAPDCLQAAA
jgi:RNA polymerase sigma-32 factor